MLLPNTRTYKGVCGVILHVPKNSFRLVVLWGFFPTAPPLQVANKFNEAGDIRNQVKWWRQPNHITQKPNACLCSLQFIGLSEVMADHYQGTSSAKVLS